MIDALLLLAIVAAHAIHHFAMLGRVRDMRERADHWHRMYRTEAARCALFVEDEVERQRQERL